MIILIVSAVIFSIFMEDKVKAKFMGEPVSEEDTGSGS